MIAALAAAALLAGWTQVGTGPDGGTVWNGRIPNTWVRGDTRPSTIYLPPGYRTSKRYPVLYLLHGLKGSPAEYWESLHLAQQLDGLVASGARPFIVVTPAGGQLVHPNRGEWAGAWERFVVGDVVPWVDEHLSTIPSPRARVLEGLSAGGYGAVDIGLRHPRLFDGLGAWDGYFTPMRDGPFAHATPAQLAAHDPVALVREEAPALRRRGTSFYISAGGNHGAVRTSRSIAFAHELGRLHLRHELWLLPRADRGHFWGATVPSALRFAVDAFRS
jgi:S-formylglutathione hydrolase FrmB